MRGQQPVAGLAEQVDDLAVLQGREVDRLPRLRRERAQVRADEVGEPQAREQRGDQPRELEPEAVAAALRVALEEAALGEDGREPVHGRQRQAEGVRHLRLRQLGPVAPEQGEDVEAARERADGTFIGRTLISHVDIGSMLHPCAASRKEDG